MKKADIPQPKYSLGDMVMFMVPGEDNYLPRRDAKRVTSVEISIKRDCFSVRYGVEGHEQTIDQSSVIKKVL